MLIRRADDNSEAGRMPSLESMAAMRRYRDELSRAGVFLDSGMLKPSSGGALVRISDGMPSVVEGPFTGCGVLMASYLLIQVRSRAEAVEWARRWPAADAQAEIEVRQLCSPAASHPL
jgi:hypothetical protein